MKKMILDGNTAAARIAYKLSQVIPMFPITPSTPMAEYCSGINAQGATNLYGEPVKMIEMQAESGVAGTLHGALLSGALSTTFTASQGLLLMIPDMFKIAAEALPAVIHVAARTVATHALSIFGDHSDVMSTRMTGFCILASATVQECQDMALAAHMLALRAQTPVLHFFDGFRTSHEIQKIEVIEDETLRKLFPKQAIDQSPFKQHALSPDHPSQFGTAQNPDVFFQNREASQPRYEAIPSILEQVFADISKETGRPYAPYEYIGSPQAKQVIIVMASATGVIEEYLKDHHITDTALLKVRMYRPFATDLFLQALPDSIERICVLDRTKENGSMAPLALDVIAAVNQGQKVCSVISGRFGLGGKDFTPACAKAVIENVRANSPQNNFTVGIDDDLSGSSLPLVQTPSDKEDIEIKIFGLGSDGSVSASKSSIKILGESFHQYVQGYFEYDSKKSGSMTISHLRISREPILSSYLLQQANYITIGNFSFVHKYNCLEGLKEKGIVVINSVFSASEINRVLPKSYVKILQEKNARLFVVNGHAIANQNGLGEKINIIMEMALFKATGLLSLEDAERFMTEDIKKTFARKGKSVIEKNLAAMKDTETALEEVDVSALTGVETKFKDTGCGSFYQDIFKPIQQLAGDTIPVSKFKDTGEIPTGTAAFEKRAIAARLPKWIQENCIQCGQCVLTCPHAALQAILIDADTAESANTNLFNDALGLKDKKYRIQLAPEDCVGCGACAKNCPALKKALEMVEAETILEAEKKHYQDLSTLPQSKQTLFSTDHAKGLQFEESYFKFPGACGGCGETPYIKIATMLFGDRMLIANATGCSSIYGGSFPSCPFTKNASGKGPAWANSLFEDNAEFGLGLKLGSRYNQNEDKSVWIIGGDGWAYDIGFGGLDHVLASGENVNILVLDNESYSNTGGQSSKGTPMGASVKLNEGGKRTHKKNLGQIAMIYRDVYVAQVALGANMSQCIKAFKEAEAYPGPSIILAYSTCVNQGFDMSDTMSEMKKAVDCGYWPLYRYDPTTETLVLDSQLNEDKYFDFLRGERRYAIGLESGVPDKVQLLQKQKTFAVERYHSLKKESENNPKE